METVKQDEIKTVWKLLIGRLEMLIVLIGFTFGFGMLKAALRKKKRS